MGCDIHVFIEKKTDKEYDIWESVQIYKVDKYHKSLEVVSPYDNRNYDIFSILAGIRGWYEPLVDPRGCPKNMSDYVSKEREWYGRDGHTHTWYDLFELRLLIKEFKATHEDEDYVYSALDGFLDSLVKYIEFSGDYVWELAPNQYRVIIWFDS